jgi:hypothetical protein
MLMIKLQSVELSAPFKLEPKLAVQVTIRLQEHCEDLGLDPETGIIHIKLKSGKRVFTSLSNAKAAYEYVSETSGTTAGNKTKATGKESK